MRSGMASGIGLLVMLAFNATEVSCSKNWSLSYKVVFPGFSNAVVKRDKIMTLGRS